MKDRVVDFPRRIRLTPVAGQEGVYDFEVVPGTVTEEGTPINKATLLKDITAALLDLGADALPDEMFAILAARSNLVKNPLSGFVTYNEPIAAGATVTKSIAIGPGKTKGRCTISNYYGAMVEFGTDRFKTLRSGTVAGQYTGGAWSRRQREIFITSSSYSGIQIAGSQINVEDCYISGENILITFKNVASAERTIMTDIDWEVW